MQSKLSFSWTTTFFQWIPMGWMSMSKHMLIKWQTSAQRVLQDYKENISPFSMRKNYFLKRLQQAHPAKIYVPMAVECHNLDLIKVWVQQKRGKMHCHQSCNPPKSVSNLPTNHQKQKSMTNNNQRQQCKTSKILQQDFITKLTSKKDRTLLNNPWWTQTQQAPWRQNLLLLNNNFSILNMLFADKHWHLIAPSRLPQNEQPIRWTWRPGTHHHGTVQRETSQNLLELHQEANFIPFGIQEEAAVQTGSKCPLQIICFSI